MKSVHRNFPDLSGYKVLLFFGPRKWFFIRSNYFFLCRKWLTIRSNNFQIFPKMDGYKVSRGFCVSPYNQPPLYIKGVIFFDLKMTIMSKQVILGRYVYVRPNCKNLEIFNLTLIQTRSRRFILVIENF